jgi:hypothetical protein
VQALLASLADMRDEEYASPGLGTQHRLSGDNKGGSALEVEGQVLHLSVFQN